MTTVQPHGLDVPRRRDGRLHRRQVFVWSLRTRCVQCCRRVSMRWKTTCVSAQREKANLIVTFGRTCQKIDCRQDGYVEDVHTGSPHDSAAARASVRVSTRRPRVALCVHG